MKQLSDISNERITEAAAQVALNTEVMFWQRVVDILNKKLASWKDYSVLEDNFLGATPQKVIVRLERIIPERDLWWGTGDERGYDVLHTAFVELRGVSATGGGELGISFVANHKLIVSGQEGLVEIVDIKKPQFVSNIGAGNITPHYELKIAGPLQGIPPHRIDEKHLNSEEISILAHIILLFSSPVAERLHGLLYSTFRSVLASFSRLYLTALEISRKRPTALIGSPRTHPFSFIF